jgi:hypothetical protein
MTDERDPEDLISEAMDAIALGYPLDGTEAEKRVWMALLQKDFELRAPIVLERLRRSLRKG